MNTDPNSTINKNLDQSIYYSYSFPYSAGDIDFFFDEDELSDEQSALRKLRQGLSLNNQYQEKLNQLLLKIQDKIAMNNTKLEKITEIIAFKNKRNKIQLKKKQIELYKYEDSKLPPESFRIFERVRHSKGKKSFQNLYKTLIEDSSSEDEDDFEESKQKDKSVDKDFAEDTLLGIKPLNNKEIKVKKNSATKSPRKKGADKKLAIKKEENNLQMIVSDKRQLYEDEDDEEEDNELDYEDEFDNDVDSEDEMRSMKKRGDRLGLDRFLEEHKDQDPTDIDWLGLARKVNSKLISDEKNSSLVTALDLYRRFISEEVQQKRTQWTDEEDKALLNAVKIHGTNNWKQVATNIEGKNTYLCFQRWAKFVNPEISKGKWRLEEDLRLALAVECFKVGNWIGISSLFKNRTDVQCRERWCNILDPTLNVKGWSKQEDELLILGVIKYGKRWAQVSKMMRTRTDNQCWRRWKMLSKKAKEVKKLTDEKFYGPLGVDYIKINMKEPFKIEKRVKKDNQEYEIVPLSQNTLKTEATTNDNESEIVETKKGRKSTKGISKKEIKAKMKAAKSFAIKDEE